jgi:hypothetical protein
MMQRAYILKRGTRPPQYRTESGGWSADEKNAQVHATLHAVMRVANSLTSIGALEVVYPSTAPTQRAPALASYALTARTHRIPIWSEDALRALIRDELSKAAPAPILEAPPEPRRIRWWERLLGSK